MRSAKALFAVATLLRTLLCSPSAIFVAPAAASYSMGAYENQTAALVLDALNRTCGPAPAAAIFKAMMDADAIMSSVNWGIAAHDPAFIEFFGSGWATAAVPNASHVPAQVVHNLETARRLLYHAVAEPGRPRRAPPAAATKLVDLTCADERRWCRDDGTVPAYTDLRNATGRQTIVFCPLYFIQASATKYLEGSRFQSVQGSWFYRETIIIHELMHLDGLGYKTAFSDGRAGASERQRGNADHITDIAVHMPGDAHPIDLYRREDCARYAALHSPPLLATANAASYAWLALEQHTQIRYLRRFRAPLDRPIRDRPAGVPRPSMQPTNGLHIPTLTLMSTTSASPPPSSPAMSDTVGVVG